MSTKKSVGDNLKPFDSMEESVQELINAAIDAREKAYDAYSGFKVGSAVRTTCGKIFTGCNVENVCHTPTICAERCAYVKAVSEGFQEFKELAVVAYQEKCITTPCGVCRQVISEFANQNDVIIYCAKPERGLVLTTSLFELLPYRYTSCNANV